MLPLLGETALSLAEVSWARGCGGRRGALGSTPVEESLAGYLSRGFPPRLLDAAAPRTGAVGVMLPFFDLLNHGVHRSGSSRVEGRP